MPCPSTKDPTQQENKGFALEDVDMRQFLSFDTQNVCEGSFWQTELMWLPESTWIGLRTIPIKKQQSHPASRPHEP